MVFTRTRPEERLQQGVPINVAMSISITNFKHIHENIYHHSSAALNLMMQYYGI